MGPDTGIDCQTVEVDFFSTPGKITAGVLQWGNNGRGGFNVSSKDGESIKGELEIHLGKDNFHAHEMTAIAVAPDLQSGWFSGVFTDGQYSWPT